MKHQRAKPKNHTFSELSADYWGETDYKQIVRLRERVKFLNTVFGHRDIHNITKFEIVEFVRNYRKQSPSMANHYLIHIRMRFKHGIGIGWLEDNPAQGINQASSIDRLESI